MVDWNRFTQHNSSTAWPSKWSSHIGQPSLGVGRDWGAHIWRDTTGNTGSLLLRTILMTEIQYNIDFSIQPCTQNIYYMPKSESGPMGAKRNSIQIVQYDSK